MLDDASVLRIVAPILTDALGPILPDALTIESLRDHDGEPVIRLTIQHAPNAPRFDARAYLNAVNEAMRRLRENGDDRFLHVRNLYADGEPASDDLPRPPRRRRRA
jgi:hypothetical protein